MTKIDPIYVGPEAVAQLVQYCEAQHLNRFTLIADANTYAAQGERVEGALKAKGYELTRIVLEGKEIIADERYLVHVLVRAPLGHSTFLAVGSGTLTDIARFTSHRMGQAFISIPTAPSVDGFASVIAPLVLDGVKQTIPCQSPIALFADLDTLASAPQKLIAAGFGDMLGKLTSLADWKLGSLLWDEPFSADIFNRTQAATFACIDHAAEIGQRSRKGVEILMNALIESGVCMLDFGDSRPASGSEHHASHYWEMKLLQENRPAIFHGAKVGVATLHIIEQYAAIRKVSRQDMQDRLEAASLPTREQEYATIRQGYPGELAEGVIREHKAFLDLTEEGFDKVKRRIVEQWDAIQALAANVPPPEQVASYLRLAGAPTDGAALGLSAAEIPLGFQYGHYLRNRFTVMKLCRVLGLPLV
jgi:glycerol-1-phosphate dehydrogenase [NAD(P)+]